MLTLILNDISGVRPSFGDFARRRGGDFEGGKGTFRDQNIISAE